MRKLLLAAAGAAALAFSGAANAAVEINFNNPTGNIGPSHTYSNGGLSVTAYGVDENLNPLDLYGKSDGGDENGVGIANDPSGDHEIWGDVGGAVILDVSALLADNVSAAQFFMGSTTGGESWNIYEWDGSDFIQALTGNTELTWTDLPDWGSTNAYAFTAGGAGQNVLLGGLSLTGGVPEPSTWAMMLLGFGAMGVALRRRKRPAVLAQIA
jgi:hypothetical protein